MMARLSDYLSAALDREWKWGQLDCFLFCADWVSKATGRDPAAAFRGRYASERAARHLIRDSGGIIALAAECLAGIGITSPLLWPQGTVKAGDVGLVRVPIVMRGRRVICAPVAAICLRPKLWVIKTRVRGEMVARDFPLICAWPITADA